jgi:hypothetical protein
LGGREGNAGCAGTERKHEEGILQIANLWFEDPMQSESDSKGVRGIFCKSLILRELEKNPQFGSAKRRQQLLE